MASAPPFDMPDVEPGAEGMSEDELASILAEHESRAIGYYTSDIASEQASAIDRYYRRPYGDEREGRSQVVDGTVSIVIDSAVAAILKPFVSAEDTVEYHPRQPEDEEAAQQATEYVNYVFQNECGGFQVLHDWFKEALLLKLGVVKAYWEREEKEEPVQRDGLDAEQAAILQQAGVTEIYGPDENGLYSAIVPETREDGNLRVENVPVEEYRLSPFSRPGRTPPYEAHVRSVYRSELIEMGYDPEIVESLSAFNESELQDARNMARYDDENIGASQTSIPGGKAVDMIHYAEEYVLVDFNGDGIAELRKVCRSKDVILYNEEVKESCFATLCPVPMPHKVIGQSLADMVLDEQRISTVILRQTLDNLYLANNPKVQVPESAERLDGSTIDALLDPAPGVVVPTRGDGIKALEIPFVADKSFPMLAYIEQQVEQRTGVSKTGQGLDTNALKKSGQMTATEMSMIEGGKNARIEMIARIFAETGVKRLFRRMLKLMVDHQPRERVIRLRNKWVTIDPRGWNPDMDLSIAVGLGVGNKMEQLQQAETVLATMERVAMSPFKSLIDQEKAYNAVKRLFTAAGIKNTSEFIVEPEKDEQGNVKQQEEPPSPEAMAAQAEAQMKAAELEGKQQEAAMKLQLMQADAAAKMELERAKAAQESELANQKFTFEADMAMRKMEFEAEMARTRADRDHEVKMEQAKMSQNRPGGDLDK